ncbi:MAG: tetratricopeptide repeat protein [Rhodanobacteraceae bacterium]|nr:tetratricopeptide repeat protein [Rhodanobacteraceae bacterium]
MSLEELDEHERSERVREWVRKNIGSIVLGLVAGIGAIYGMEQWGHYRQRNAGLAGDDYRVYAEAVIKKDATAVATLGKSLRDKYPDSPYASMVALNDAATAVTDGKTDAALTSLEWAEAHATMPEVKSLSMLRRARLLIAIGKADAALELANKVEGDGFKPLAAEVRGDALLALKRNSEAIAAYDEALVGLDSGATRRSIVEMKRDDLASTKVGS